MRQAYWNYIEDVISIEHDPEQNNMTNTKQLWTYIKHRKSTSGDLAGKLSGYFGARYLAKERIFDSLISILSALYIT